MYEVWISCIGALDIWHKEKQCNQTKQMMLSLTLYLSGEIANNNKQQEVVRLREQLTYKVSFEKDKLNVFFFWFISFRYFNFVFILEFHLKVCFWNVGNNDTKAQQNFRNLSLVNYLTFKVNNFQRHSEIFFILEILFSFIKQERETTGTLVLRSCVTVESEKELFKELTMAIDLLCQREWLKLKCRYKYAFFTSPLVVWNV